MKHPETCEISQTADSHKVDELAMLVRRLVQSLRKAAPDNDISDQALDYLKRYGMGGTLLRDVPTNVPLNVPAGLNPGKASEVVGTFGSTSAPEYVPKLRDALREAKCAINSMKAEAETAAQGDEQMMLEACEQISKEGLEASLAIDAVLCTWDQEPALGQAVQPVQSATCNDHGMIGGPSFYDPGEGGQPCPDCEVRHRNDLAAGDLIAWAAEVGGNRIAENVVEMTRDDLQRLIAERTPLAQAGSRDAAFEAVRKKFCKLQRYSFFLDDKGNVRRTPDYCGNWVEFEAVHTLFEPAVVDAAIAAQAAQGGD
ncbi:hypothetical protein CtesDRAFT_PD3393 [Comamonas testosteroni KF-1]|uniref:Uncharacterized protein n=2 Tax=Comamonas testosteroni TaxID=285 RepID=B7X1U0_COMTK|nr:hypothetical protein CtesDRAFT_PD3330 [Comamonas testosteroni KF-1]EED68446.1 hypothetical protein CtesDRAFT_PD3393 [Comamonas testosteroni KF-1]